MYVMYNNVGRYHSISSFPLAFEYTVCAMGLFMYNGIAYENNKFKQKMCFFLGGENSLYQKPPKRCPKPSSHTTPSVTWKCRKLWTRSSNLTLWAMGLVTVIERAWMELLMSLCGQGTLVRFSEAGWYFCSEEHSVLWKTKLLLDDGS